MEAKDSADASNPSADDMARSAMLSVEFARWQYAMRQRSPAESFANAFLSEREYAIAELDTLPVGDV